MGSWPFHKSWSRLGTPSTMPPSPRRWWTGAYAGRSAAASVRGRNSQRGARRPRRVLVLTRRSGPFAAGDVGRAGGGPRRAPCVLAQRDGQPSRPPAAVEGSGHYGSQFPLIGSRLQPDQGPDVSSETRWTHAQDRRACRCARAPRFLRLPCCPSPKICAGELAALQLGKSKCAGTP